MGKIEGITEWECDRCGEKHFAHKGDSYAKEWGQPKRINSSLDEATCTQLVYLYNEINRNYQGDAHLFFEIMGRLRTVPKETMPSQTETRPTLRVACRSSSSS